MVKTLPAVLKASRRGRCCSKPSVVKTAQRRMYISVCISIYKCLYISIHLHIMACMVKTLPAVLKASRRGRCCSKPSVVKTAQRYVYICVCISIYKCLYTSIHLYIMACTV